MMGPKADGRNDGIDWRLTTWDGAQQEQLRRWAELPLENIIRALEEMEQLAKRLTTIAEQ